MTSTGQKDASGSSRLSSTAERIWADLMEGNKRFREGKPATRELVERRAELASGQIREDGQPWGDDVLRTPYAAASLLMTGVLDTWEASASSSTTLCRR